METSDLFLQKAKDHYRFRLLGEPQADAQPAAWLVFVLPPLLLALVVIAIMQLPIRQVLRAEVQSIQPNFMIVQLPTPLLPVSNLSFSAAPEQQPVPLQWQFCPDNRSYRCLKIRLEKPVPQTTRQLTLIATTRFIDDVFK